MLISVCFGKRIGDDDCNDPSQPYIQSLHHTHIFHINIPAHRDLIHCIVITTDMLGMLRDVLGWMDHLLASSQQRRLDNANWVICHNDLKCTQHTGRHSRSDKCTTRPVDMLSIHCQADICVFRKVDTLKGIKCLIFKDCRPFS